MTGARAELISGLIALLAGWAALPARAADAAGPVRIGFFMSITGRDASFGEASLQGAALAVDRLNAEGGVLGRTVELVVEDDRSLDGESATAAKKLISRDRVVALVGECASARTLEAAPIAQASRIPLVTPASTSARVTATGDDVFRVCFVDSFQGRVMATFARRRLGLAPRRAAGRRHGALFGRPGRVLCPDLRGAGWRGRRPPELCGRRHRLPRPADRHPRGRPRRDLPTRLLRRRRAGGPPGARARPPGDPPRRRRIRGPAAPGDRRRRARGRLLLDPFLGGKRRPRDAALCRGLPVALW